MLKRLLLFVKELIQKGIIHQKEEKIMVSKKEKRFREKIPSSEFSKHIPASEIRRYGKNVVIVDKSGSLVLGSQKHVRDLGKDVLKNNSSAIIKVNGLSRAQVGRIAGVLKDSSSNAEVYIRKTPKHREDRTKAMNFEILLMGGSQDEV